MNENLSLSQKLRWDVELLVEDLGELFSPLERPLRIVAPPSLALILGLVTLSKVLDRIQEYDEGLNQDNKVGNVIYRPSRDDELPGLLELQDYLMTDPLKACAYFKQPTRGKTTRLVTSKEYVMGNGEEIDFLCEDGRPVVGETQRYFTYNPREESTCKRERVYGDDMKLTSLEVVVYDGLYNSGKKIVETYREEYDYEVTRVETKRVYDHKRLSGDPETTIYR